MPAARAARTLPLVLLLAACSHARAVADPAGGQEPGPEAPPAEAPQEPEREVDAGAAEAPKGATAQVIEFTGDDAEPEPPSQIRSAPKRPPIPSFKLYGTRPDDGPGGH